LLHRSTIAEVAGMERRILATLHSTDLEAKAAHQRSGLLEQAGDITASHINELLNLPVFAR